jgi:BioD-like phosphotransacetylase family protein
MRRLIVASMREGAGKTSVIIGLGRALRTPVGYMKPFGDRLLYRKKRLWDYDSALVASVLGLQEDPENMSIGFDHSKLRFMFDEEATKEKLLELLAHVEQGKEIVFIEAGKDLAYGISVNLDPISLARYTGATLIIVLSGEESAILDDATFAKRRVDLAGVPLAGIIANQVHDTDDFRNTYQSAFTDMDVPVLGIIPYRAELTHPSVGFLSECLFAKVLAGEAGLGAVAKDIFVGAMSAEAARRHPSFGKEQKLVITSGAEQGIPLLLVADDTYQVAKQIDDTQYLLTRDEHEKIELLGELAKDHLDLTAIVGQA